MTAPVRLKAVRSFDILSAHWHQAVPIRREWHAWGLSSVPADRAGAEDSLVRIYRRIGRGRPRIEWVDSPRQARPRLDGLPTHEDLRRWVVGRTPPGRPPLAGDLAAALSRLRSALDLADGFYLPIRAVLGIPGTLPVGWYGQQDAGWIAYYDVMRRLGLGRFASADNAALDDWAALARSCGWWWPDENRIVVVERPAVVRTAPVPGAWHDQTRLDRSGPAPVEYRDGWQPFAG